MKIINIKSLGKQKVRNLTVEKNHTFITENGIVTHNCNSAQPALRGFIEEFSNNCRFIITCNFKNKIIEPIHSRCTPVDFRFSNKEKLEAIKEFIKRTENILTKEGITFDKRVLAEFIVEYFPDFRRVLGELQKYGSCGKIDAGILSRLSDETFSKLVEFMKTKN